MIPFLDQLKAYHQTAAFCATASNPDAVFNARVQFLRAKLEDPKQFTSRDVETALEISNSAASRFMNQLRHRGMIECVRPFNPGRHRLAVWGFVK